MPRLRPPLLRDPTVFDARSLPGLQADFIAEPRYLRTVAAGSTFVSADGDVVGQWDDASGNARNATQATAALKPLWRPAQQGVLFDGVDDYVRTAAWTAISTGMVYVVGEITGSTATQRVFFGGIATGVHWIVYRRVTTLDLVTYQGTTNVGLMTIPGPLPMSVCVGRFTGSLNTSNAYRNGARGATPASSGTVAVTGISIGEAGGADYLSGVIRRVAVYSQVHSDADIQRATRQLAAQHGVWTGAWL